jgi:hypothetical protein
MDNYGMYKIKSAAWSARPPVTTPTSTRTSQLAEHGGTIASPKLPNYASVAEATMPLWRRQSSNYLDRRSQDPKPYVWNADADLILGKIS